MGAAASHAQISGVAEADFALGKNWEVAKKPKPTKNARSRGFFSAVTCGGRRQAGLILVSG